MAKKKLTRKGRVISARGAVLKVTAFTLTQHGKKLLSVKKL